MSADIAKSSKTAWLSAKLKEFALDEEIYLNYIESVLDGEEDRCEKFNALEAILAEVLSENEIQTQCMEIINVYDTVNVKDNEVVKKLTEDPEETLVKMMENNIRTVVSVPSKVNKQNSNEEDSDLAKIRKNILSQYAQKELADSDEEETSDLDIEHNTNVSNVLALKKEQRERAKEQSLRKKEKDKEDREKQKQLAQEKKDAKKKKAQKVERKR